jgi:RNA polymerase nonessential primary-like sigma factor
MRQTRIVQLPVHVVQEINLCLRASRHLSAKVDHLPTARDIAEYLGKPVAAVERILEMNEKVTSLDAPLQTGSDTSCVETIADSNQRPVYELLEEEELLAKLAEWLDRLPERQREVLSRRFGLGGGPPETLEEVARTLGLAVEGVRQVQIKALARLRGLLEEQGFSSETLFH